MLIFWGLILLIECILSFTGRWTWVGGEGGGVIGDSFSNTIKQQT